MKRDWTPEELAAYFSLSSDERHWLRGSEDHTSLAFAVQLKCFQYKGAFVERPQDIPSIIIEELARQLGLATELWLEYDWQGRSAERHRALIREQLGFRPMSLADGQDLVVWLEAQLDVQQADEFVQVEQIASIWFRQHQIEPPSAQRLERLIHQAVRRFETKFAQALSAKLSPLSRQKLDELLLTVADDDAEGIQTSLFSLLKRDPQDLSLKELLSEIEKLKQLRSVHLPMDLFLGVPPHLTKRYRRRAAAEPPRELRQHPESIRYMLVAAFVWQRQHEVTDNLVELFTQVVHKTRTHAERRVDAAYLADIKQVHGKTDILARLAEAALNNPDGTVRDVIFPVVSEQTLRDVLAEYRASGTYQRQVYTKMRTSYGLHYRRLLAPLLKTLVFRSNNPAYHPILDALDLLKRYLNHTRHDYPAAETVPLRGVVPPAWLESVVENLPQRRRINRVNYEICVLHALRDALRSREIWVEGADRFRNPDADLATDFDENRAVYYATLKQPLDVEAFIGHLQTEMHQQLDALDAELPENRDVQILERGGHWIKLSPLPAQPQPPFLSHLHRDIGRTWGAVDLLDMLKEADLRVQFTAHLRTSA